MWIGERERRPVVAEHVEHGQPDVLVPSPRSRNPSGSGGRDSPSTAPVRSRAFARRAHREGRLDGRQHEPRSHDERGRARGSHHRQPGPGALGELRPVVGEVRQRRLVQRPGDRPRGLAGNRLGNGLRGRRRRVLLQRTLHQHGCGQRRQQRREQQAPPMQEADHRPARRLHRAPSPTRAATTRHALTAARAPSPVRARSPGHPSAART